MSNAEFAGQCKDKRSAKRVAYDITWRLIDNYFDVGQPFDDCIEVNHPDEDECPKCRRLTVALKELRAEMFRRWRK